MNLTVDLDWPEKLQIVKSWHYLERHGDGPVQGRISSGGHGVHLQAGETLEYPVEVNERHRRMAGDDPTRIRGDKENVLQENQVLYTHKGDREVGLWHYSLRGLLAAYDRSANRTPNQHRCL